MLATTPFAAVILAAGQGTRMKSPLPKPLLPVAGRPMVHHVLEVVRALGAEPVVAVVGHQAEVVRAALPAWCRSALQAEQRGTGHALQCAQEQLAGFTGPLLVLYADTPLLRPETITGLLEEFGADGTAAALLSVILPDGGSYGRVVREGDTVAAIVEAADCTPEQRAIREVNAGMYVFQAPAIFDILGQLRGDNAKGELYLTDAVALLRRAGGTVRARLAAEPLEALGVNTPEELAAAEAVMARRGGHHGAV